MDKILQLINTKPNNKGQFLEIPEREGIELEKGVSLTEEYLKSIEKLLIQYFDIFIVYPDLLLDMIKPKDSSFDLYFYQRILLRALMRYKQVYVTAPRAFAKSFISILGLMLQCIFLPGTKRFICAPFKQQGAKVAKEKIVEIYDTFPLLKREIVGGDIYDTPGNFSKDYVTLKFRNGSVLDVVGVTDSTRGGRRHGGLIDEVRDHEEEPINEIVLP